ncbi:MAG: DegT/DnrJ/EryC1/StrS family aminotransferase [Prevotella sp.]|nr:DegT/DnrJ/EryC1/StrS family aminotransferase [Prevotella sp.]
MKIPFSPPYVDETVINEVVDSLRSGWITTGPKVKALEQEIIKLTGTQAALGVNSWTSGALMTLRWWGIQPGDEVIIPAYTYCATAMAPMWAGAKVVMVDSGTDFNISVDAIRQAITPKTKAIIPVDIAGYPCDYDAIMSLVCEPHIRAMFKPSSEIQEKMGRILVLSDSAHSIGARYHGKSNGTETDIAVFSLHAVKNVTTAEGGMICFNMPEPFDNEQLYKEFRLMSLNCQTKDAFTKSQAGGWRYDIVGKGMKVNMADINAAIGLAQLRQYDKLLKERHRVYEAYNTAFSACPWAILPPYRIADRETSCHVYALRVRDFTEQQRDAMIAEIAKHDVAVNVHFVPLPMLSYYKGLGYDITDYPQAYRNYVNEISLPVYPQLDDEKVNVVIQTVIKAYHSIKSQTSHQ